MRDNKSGFFETTSFLIKTFIIKKIILPYNY